MKKRETKIVITKEMTQLVKALKEVGINSTLTSYSVRCMDCKNHFCTFIETNFECGEEELSFTLHPYTGKLVKSCLDCPISKE